MKRSFFHQALLCCALVPLIGGSGWVSRALASSPLPVKHPALSRQTAESGNDLIDGLTAAHEVLFPGAFTLEHMLLELNEPVREAGTVSGSNYESHPFTLDVVMATPIALEVVEGMSQSFREEAAGIGFQLMSVVAEARSERGRIGLTGLAYHGVIDGVCQARLLITSVGDQSLPVFETALQSAPAPSVQWLSAGAIREAALAALPSEYSTVVEVLEPSLDCVGCYDHHSQALEQAGAGYQQAREQAEAQHRQDLAAAASARDQIIRGCDGAYGTQRAAADRALGIDLAFCHGILIGAMVTCALLGLSPMSWFTLGVVAALCIALAHAAYAQCIVNAVASHTTVVNTAGQVRQLCIDNAHLAYQNAVHAAEIRKLNALIAALVANLEAIDAANEVRAICLAGCESGGGERGGPTAIRRLDLVDLLVEGMR